MGRGTLSATAYRVVEDRARAAGSSTFAGEQRKREGKGLHPLVDPKGFGVIRRSISWLEPEGDKFSLMRGPAILEETRLDTTGSMGDNVDIAMRVLPTTYGLLSTGKGAVLGRYDTHMITSIFGDVSDNYVLCRSQAEHDERIAEQMTFMVPEGDGGDPDEDPQYGLFAGAYLTKAQINEYGLKYYDFTVSDARGRSRIDDRELVRIFGDEVFEKVAENGYQFDRRNIPSTKEVVADLKKNAHAFFLQVGKDLDTNYFWTRVFGSEYVVMIPRTEMLPQVKAAIIGLTEGVLDLQSVVDFLEGAEYDEGSGLTRQRKRTMTKAEAQEVKRAIAHIPLRAQANLPNFNKIPLKGALFAKKGDLWPIGEEAEKSVKKTPTAGKKPAGKMWL